MAAAKEKAIQLVPGADVKAVLGDGDDLIQTHVGSGILFYLIITDIIVMLMIHPNTMFKFKDFQEVTRRIIRSNFLLSCPGKF